MRSYGFGKRPSAALSLVFALGGLIPGVARADYVSGLRSEELKERSHDIRMSLAPGHAELVVRRTVYNGGPRHDQATFMIDLPPGAVATGLRTLGTLAGRPHWFDGELLEAEAAAERYRELTGIGGYYPKDPALLSWRSQDLLALQVFPCAPKEPKSIEYTLVVPTVYRGGAHHIDLPALGTEELIASVVAKSSNPGFTLEVGGAAPPSVVRPERGDPLDYAVRPKHAERLDGELVATEFAPERVVLHYAAYAAPKLSEVPKKAHLVVAIDASLSTDSEFITRAKLALDAYLAHFDAPRAAPGSNVDVELLVYHRKIERSFGRFLPVHEARTKLAALDIRRKNGSEADRALYEADRLLAATPSGAARRIVLVTDGLGREGLTPERLRAATSKSGAATHVGILSEGGAALERDEGHPWASGLVDNHGLVWQASAREGQTPDELQKVYEEWARPVRLHHFRAYGSEPELAESFTDVPMVLDEGEGVQAHFIGATRPAWLAFEGELWTEPLRTRLHPDPKKEKLWAALTFGSPLVWDLSEEEMMTLALKGRAVSPVTSYLAIEPGVRPSTEGLEETGQGFGAGGGRLRGAHTTVSGRGPELDRQAFLERMLKDDWRRCGGRPGEASVTLETTLAEIVHIGAVTTKDRDPLLGRCLTESVWNLILPAAFDDDWNRSTVDV